MKNVGYGIGESLTAFHMKEKGNIFAALGLDTRIATLPKLVSKGLVKKITLSEYLYEYDKSSCIGAHHYPKNVTCILTPKGDFNGDESITRNVAKYLGLEMLSLKSLVMSNSEYIVIYKNTPANILEKYKTRINNSQLIVKPKYTKRANRNTGRDYVSNSELLPLFDDWDRSKPMPNSIGKAVLLIATNLSKRYNFAGYSYIDEMIATAAYQCTCYCKNFSSDKSNNPVAYISTLCYNAFVQVIKLQNIQQKKKMAFLNEVLTATSNESALHAYSDIITKTGGNKVTDTIPAKMFMPDLEADLSSELSITQSIAFLEEHLLKKFSAFEEEKPLSTYRQHQLDGYINDIEDFKKSAGMNYSFHELDSKRTCKEVLSNYTDALKSI